MRKPFKDIYAELYLNYEQIEKLRIRQNRMPIIKGISILVGFILILKIIINVLQKDIPINDFKNIILMIIIFCMVMIYIKASSEVYNSKFEYKAYYKQEIIKPLIESYEMNLEYKSYGGDIEAYYNQAKFEEYDYLNSEDYISGEKIKMSEVKTEINQIDTNGIKKRITNFYGLFSVYKSNKIINSTIDIVFDKGMDTIETDGKVVLDSIEFEKYFDVYGIDKNQITELLTPEIMECLIKIRTKSKNKFSIRLKSDNIFIRMYCGDIFEANKQINALDMKTIKNAYDLIDVIINLSEKMAGEIEKNKI